jgi:2-oxoglutarate dehydrogenase E1 component
VAADVTPDAPPAARYEGNGPEHSSARLERFLQLAGAGEHPDRQPTTAAQSFHMLRRQALDPGRAAAGRDDAQRACCVCARPLSSLEELSDGAFQPVIDDPQADTRACGDSS